MSPSESDRDLLQSYAATGSEEAFAALVRRHLDLVYSAARRQVRSPQLAEEITQAVFLDLSRTAGTVPTDAPLAAWLYVVTRRTAVDAIRRESRRQAREHAAYEIAAMNSPATPDWPRVEPLLDEAMESLDADARSAVLLRYFENKSLREVGEALGTSDDTAQKRVSRAVDQLRAFFLKRGVAVSATTLATDLSAHAIQSAPATVLTATLAANAAAIPISTGIATTTFMSTKIITTVAVVSVISAGLYSHFHQVRSLQSEIAALSARNTRMATQYNRERQQRLADEKDREGNRVAQQLLDESSTGNGPNAGSEYLAKLNVLKDYLDKFPQTNIPELELLLPVDWLRIATEFPLENETDVRKALAELRLSAKKRLGPKFAEALKTYVAANNDALPNNPAELTPYFVPPIPPRILLRYKMTITGDAGNAMKGGTLQTVVTERDRVDDTYDSELHISPLGSWGWTSGSSKPSDFQVQLEAAGKRWQEAHPGQSHPLDRAEVRTYVDPSVNQDQLEYWIKTGRQTKDEKP